MLAHPQILGLEASPQQLLDESEPLMAARCGRGQGGGQGQNCLRDPAAEYLHGSPCARYCASGRAPFPHPSPCSLHSLPPAPHRWADAPLMPGALRLVRHLAARGVPFAVATSTPRATFNAKMAAKAELRALLGGDGAAAPVAVVCGDEVGWCAGDEVGGGGEGEGTGYRMMSLEGGVDRLLTEHVGCQQHMVSCC